MKNKILLIIFTILVFSNLVLATGTISGYVKDINGNSLANATVTTNIVGFTNSTITDATGFYNITVTTTPAIYNLTANLTNYATPSTYQKLIQTNLETHQNIILTASSGTIAINIKNNTGNNLASAGINIYNSSNSLISSGLTDSIGNLNINLSAGNYNISASASGYYDNSTTTNLILGTTSNVNLILTNIPPVPPSPPSSPSGGGGGGGGGCTSKWNCTEWTSCNKNGVQTRICKDTRDCFNSYNKPIEFQSCKYTECTSNSQCSSGYECNSNKCTKKPVIENKTIIPEETITEQISNVITGFSIKDYVIKLKDSKVATIILAIFLGILSGIAVFTYLRRKY